VPVRRGYRFELVKLLAQWPIRLVLLACWLGPALFVAVISEQSSLPADTVFGRWMSQTASLVAGDVFATEDRLAGLAASAVVGGLDERSATGRS
jgi:ABC-2 type transport system permease protein